jgi:hypothetical protein
LKPWLASAAAGFIVTALASTAADAVSTRPAVAADVRFAPNSRQIADISACPLCADFVAKVVDGPEEQ